MPALLGLCKCVRDSVCHACNECWTPACTLLHHVSNFLSYFYWVSIRIFDLGPFRRCVLLDCTDSAICKKAGVYLVCWDHTRKDCCLLLLVLYPVNCIYSSCESCHTLCACVTHCACGASWERVACWEDRYDFLWAIDGCCGSVLCLWHALLALAQELVAFRNLIMLLGPVCINSLKEHWLLMLQASQFWIVCGVCTWHTPNIAFWWSGQIVNVSATLNQSTVHAK
jgi:hypothetical protein